MNNSCQIFNIQQEQEQDFSMIMPPVYAKFLHSLSSLFSNSFHNILTRQSSIWAIDVIIYKTNKTLINNLIY